MTANEQLRALGIIPATHEHAFRGGPGQDQVCTGCGFTWKVAK